MAGLQQQNLESRKELSASIDGVSQRIDLLEANTEHIIGLSKSLPSTMRSLSQKVDSQNRVSADRQKNLEDRLISMAGLQRQNLESRKELSASIDGVSQRIALLEANTEQHITDLNEKMNRDNTAITKITRILFAPINFFFNLEEDDNSSTQNK
jgi:hypothetical protein